MGCGGSKSGDGGAGGGGGGSAAKGGGGGKGGQKRLLDTYNVGEMLGQGAFGIVYACTPSSGQDKDCAVKMVDKVETPVDKIKEEAEMLQQMDHPNVIKCYDVIYEKCFVCIVMERLRGGDLIVGMQAHWKSKGKIPVQCTIPISAQMATSLNYLHKDRGVIHRDVKGDNYLCDRADITDPQCRIVLTDFGTAVACKPTERLREKCGTKLYWSQEFYKLDYSLKVDIWAMGVVVYGLLNGKFPFRDEKDIATKAVTTPKGTPAECTDFVLKLLGKKEDQRASSQEAVDHVWVKGKAANTKNDDNSEEFKPDEEAFKEGGANAGVADRRNELVERMQEGGAKRTSKGNKPEEHYWKEWFSIVDRHAQNSTLKYEWWASHKVDEAGILSVAGAKAVNEANASNASNSVQVVGQQLNEHGVDTSKFGQGRAKSLEELAQEVTKGSSVLMLDAEKHKKLVRVVDVVLLKICAPGTKNKFLLETGEKYPDGRVRMLSRLPGTKRNPHENSKQVVERVVHDMLDLQGANIAWDFDNKEVFEEREESPSFPGLETVYRKEIVGGTLAGDPKKYIGADAKSETDWFKKDENEGYTRYWAWKMDKDLDKLNIKYKQPTEEQDISGLVQAPIGMGVEELKSYLEKNKVDMSKFGDGQAKSLKDISAELIKGESCLMLEKDGTVIRIVDVVVVKLVHSVTQSILVQTEQTYPDGAKVSLKRLPGAKRRPDENQFLTARRILKRQLKIEENHVAVDASSVQVVEEEKESLAYPGLRTVYRKRIITASLSK